MTAAYALEAALTHRPAPPRWRWGVVVPIVVGLHLASAIWLANQPSAFTPAATVPPVEVALLQPERIARGPAHPHVGTKAPARPAATHPQRRIKPAVPALQAVTPAPLAPGAKAQPAAVGAPASAPTPSAGAAGSTAKAAQPASGNGATTPGPAQTGVKFSVPPSGDLTYDTFYNGVQNPPGTIHWASDGKTYRMVVSVPLPFVGTFTYSSEGRIDAFGLAPEHYVEHRGHRGESVTTFERAAKRIAFTRTSKTLALPEGAQDRFSMVMQLASLVRGDPQAYRPGVTRNFYVADNDTGETWPIETIGDEMVRTAGGYVGARHFMRLPRHAGDTRRIDVWLAPSLGWLPVRIMQTEPNGTVVELVWRGRLAGSGAKNASSIMTPQDLSGVAPAPPPAREMP